MLLYHQQDQVEKMYFKIVFNLSLHQVDDKATCQTQLNIFTFFLSPSWRHEPKFPFYFYFVNDAFIALFHQQTLNHGQIGI